MGNSARAIYEFSTGITFRELPNGDWVSLGFTGSYINSSIKEIPYEVNRAIANRLFAVAEGASRDRPTVIGRVVKNEWSVIAYVSRGRDEKGRSASFYRYFLSEGPDRLPRILKYIRKTLKGNAAFNPLQPPRVAELLQRDAQISLSEEYDQFVDQELPPLLDPNAFKVEILDAIATHRADINNQPIAWAYNVEALEKPHQFQAICPASNAAAERISRALQSKPRVSSYAVDERAIKTAITKLTNSSTFKSQAMDALLNGVEEVHESVGELEAQDFWNAFFDGQGVDNAIRKKIKSDQMVRLMTLRAIILPSTLPDFVDWLGPLSSKNKRYDACDTSLALQDEISHWAQSSRSRTLDYLLQSGVIALMEDAHNSPQVSPSRAALILTVQGNVWNTHWHSCASVTKQYLQTQHLKQNGEAIIESKPWKQIITGMRVPQPHIRKQINSHYRSLGQMFDRLGEPVLAACAYQAAQGFVPKDVYERAKSDREEFANTHPYQSQYPLARKTTLTEKVGSNFSKTINSPIFFPTALVFLLLSLTGAVFTFRDAIFAPRPLIKGNVPASPNADAAAGGDSSERNINNQVSNSFVNYESGLSQGELVIAERSFPKGSKVTIKALVSQIAQISQPEAETETSKEQQREALKTLIFTLSGNELSDESMIRFDLDRLLFLEQDLPAGQRRKWIDLISFYQRNNAGLDEDGILTMPGETYNALKDNLMLPDTPTESDPLLELNNPVDSSSVEP